MDHKLSLKKCKLRQQYTYQVHALSGRSNKVCACRMDITKRPNKTYYNDRGLLKYVYLDLSMVCFDFH